MTSQRLLKKLRVTLTMALTRLTNLMRIYVVWFGRMELRLSTRTIFTEDTALDAFMNEQDLVNDSQWQRAAPKVLCDGMTIMDLKKRDNGSTSLGQKEKSLILRWFLPKLMSRHLLRHNYQKERILTCYLGMTSQ